MRITELATRLVLAAVFLMPSALWSQRCTSHKGVSVTAAGYTPIIPPPTDKSGSIHVCALYLSVTQGTAPANFQTRGCNEATCTTNPTQELSPLWTGHASYVDTYNLQFNEDTQLSVQRGNGLYLYLSAAPTAAQIQVFYGYY